MGYLVSRYGERPGQEPRSIAIDRPYPTVVKDAMAAISRRSMSRSRTPTWSVTTPTSLSRRSCRRDCTQTPVMGFIASLQNNTARGALDEPAGTVLAGANHHAVVTPFLSEMRGRSDARAADDPLSTATGQATHAVVAPFVTSYFTNGDSGHATARLADEPLATVPTKARFSPVVARLTAPPLTPAMLKRAKMVARFLHAHGVWHDRRRLSKSRPA
jgi:DNA (cytosine-5)-methyltransferase 1